MMDYRKSRPLAPISRFRAPGAQAVVDRNADRWRTIDLSQPVPPPEEWQPPVIKRTVYIREQVDLQGKKPEA